MRWQLGQGNPCLGHPNRPPVESGSTRVPTPVLAAALLVGAACSNPVDGQARHCDDERVLLTADVAHRPDEVTAVIRGLRPEPSLVLTHSTHGDPAVLEPTNYAGIARVPWVEEAPVTLLYQARPDPDAGWRDELSTRYALAPGSVLTVADPAPPVDPDVPTRTVEVLADEAPLGTGHVAIHFGCQATRFFNAPGRRVFGLEVDEECVVDGMLEAELHALDVDDKLLGVAFASTEAPPPVGTTHLRALEWRTDPDHIAASAPELPTGREARWDVFTRRCGRTFLSATGSGGEVSLPVAPPEWADELLLRYEEGQRGGTSDEASSTTWARVSSTTSSFRLDARAALPPVHATLERQADGLHVRLRHERPLPVDTMVEVRLELARGGLWRHTVPGDTESFRLVRLLEPFATRLGPPVAGTVVARAPATTPVGPVYAVFSTGTARLPPTGEVYAESVGTLEIDDLSVVGP